MNAEVPASPRWFVRGDIDGFFGLALDNLIQILLLTTLGKAVLGFTNELIYGRLLPGVAISLVVGNVYYAFLAWQYRLAWPLRHGTAA